MKNSTPGGANSGWADKDDNDPLLKAKRARFDKGIDQLKELAKLSTALDPNNAKIQSKLMAEEVDKAKRVRDSFLAYRKQINDSLALLAKHGDQNDAQAKQMQTELVGLSMVLDKLEKRKRVTADTLLDFMTQFKKVGQGMDKIGEDPKNTGPMAQQLREHKKEREEDEKNNNRRTKELEESLGTSLEHFVRKNATLVSSGSSTVLKGALASLLGPGAPLLGLLDELVDIDKQIDKLAQGTVNAVKATVTSIAQLPAKIASKSASVAENMLSWFKSRWTKEDQAKLAENKQRTSMWDLVYQNTKDMRAKLKSISESSGGMGKKFISGLVAVLGMVMKQIKTILNPVTLARTLLKTLSPSGILGALGSGAKLLGKGASKVWKGAKTAGGALMNGMGLGGGKLGRVARSGGKWLGRIGAAASLGSGAFGAYEGYNDKEATKLYGESGTANKVASAAVHMLSGMTLGLVSPETVGDATKAIASKLADVMLVVMDALKDLGKSAGKAADAVKEAWTSAKDWVSHIWETAKSGTVDAAKATVAKTKEVAAVVGTAVTKRAQQVGQDVQELSAATGEVAGKATKWAGQKLGFLSAEHEGRADSVSKDNNGSMAYGKYQFNSKAGGLNKFFESNPEYVQQFKGIDPESKEFGAKWRKLAKTDPNFELAQDKAGKSKFYDPAAKEAEKLGYKLDNQGVREAIFSGAVNHGKVVKILEDAAAAPGFANMTAEQQVSEFYKARNNYVDKAGVKGGAKVINQLHKRYEQEEKQARALAAKPDERTDVAVGKVMSQQPNNKVAAAALSVPVRSERVPDAKAVPPAVRQAPSAVDKIAETTATPASSSNNVQSAQKPSSMAQLSPVVGSEKLTIDTIPFLPDDTSLLAINIAGLIG